eukprot:TRINITY_DN1677_c1_g1_i2.p1 TRINITY_DN1677_c1_g1~~TRINITY_DN1677_c1_g1_i2.p1  ORF type:complete len:303 (+),score=59.32 TRINITY_DN1677_c1_g1_i2:596-1504(+)
MSVLVIGANGYIGFGVAQVLRQHGYKVYGLVRKQEQSAKLALQEIIPVVGDGADKSTYQHIVKRVNVVIDATTDQATHLASIEAVKDHANSQTISVGKKIFIFTSGLLVHGHSDELYTDEANTNPPEFLLPRLKLESEIVNAKEYHGIVIRPGFVYGYAGGNGGAHLGDKVFKLKDGKIVISGGLDKRWSWVHVHDLAHAYLLAIQKFTVASGQVFDVATESSPTYVEFRKKAAEVAGHKDAPVVQLPVDESNPWAKLFEVSIRVSAHKARNLLGWTPSHVSFLDDLEPIFHAYTHEKLVQN